MALKELVGALYDLLEPADSSLRRKAIRAVITMLDDEPVADAGLSAQRGADADPALAEENSERPRKARDWMRQNSISEEVLSSVFHLDGENVEVIAHEVPGSTAKQKTMNAYLLTGIANLFATGDAKFDDKSARELCRRMGFFSESNHATYIKDKGNVLSGTKELGWALTSPGLKAAAELVKLIGQS